MGLVVCPEGPASRVGADVLSQGGNCADAAVAAAFAQCVVNPSMCSLSGTAILMHMDPATGPTVMNGEAAIGSGPVPADWIETLGARSEAIGRYHVASEDNQAGVSSAMTPGFVAACGRLLQTRGSGRLSWHDALQPARQLALDGFEFDAHLSRNWSANFAAGKPAYPSARDKLARDDYARGIFLKNGEVPYAPGERLRQPDLAATLDRLAEAGPEDFYRGDIARTMAADFARRGSLITAADLAAYEVIEQPAVSARFRDHELWTTPPPSPGVQLLEMLAILDLLDPAPEHLFTPDGIDVLCRVMRAGFTDNRDIKALDLERSEQWTRAMMDPERHQTWAERIRTAAELRGPAAGTSTGTTHLVVLDDHGHAVSFTHSVGSGAGSGSATPGLGFLHNNFLGHFDPRPGLAMSIKPGRRIGSGLPTIGLRDGTVRLVIGAPGGSRIITSVFQVIVDHYVCGTPIDAAVERLRFHSEEETLIHLEPGQPDALAEALRARGNSVDESDYQARVQAIVVGEDGTASPGIDPRGGTAARSSAAASKRDSQP